MSEIKTVYIGDIAFNTDITPKGSKTSIGGAAYYSAVGAITASKISRNNPSVGIVGPVGEDFDLEYLSSKGINTDGSPVLVNERTCHFVITQHTHGARDFSAERNVASIVRTDIFPDHYKTAEYIHLATSLPQNYITWISHLLDKTNAVISTDAFEAFASEYPQETIAALNMSQLIFINEVEANILEKKGKIRTDVPWVLKRGSGGASYLNGRNEITVRAPKVKTIETTGAGDVLAGVFLGLLSNGYETEESLTIAVNIASLSVTKFGVEHLIY